MDEIRMFSATVYSVTKPLDDDSQRERALIALAAEAGRNGYLLDSTCTRRRVRFSANRRTYEALYTAPARPMTVDELLNAAHRPAPAPHDHFRGDADTMVLRSHRSPLHSMKALGAAVEMALTMRSPHAARIALHLIGVEHPQHPGHAETVTHLFTKPLTDPEETPTCPAPPPAPAGMPSSLLPNLRAWPRTPPAG